MLITNQDTMQIILNGQASTQWLVWADRMNEGTLVGIEREFCTGCTQETFHSVTQDAQLRRWVCLVCVHITRFRKAWTRKEEE